ncbi:protein LTV1 homolog [Drosophila nasuta]|uniref:Protein LTV1 homolog n=1 Tax=Drosophila albomicans TaxID=7291 RepID=A0A6P8X3N2_DROAB|nr:protein LTV1 homolog [Drosophila albomicans]XP_060660798.1 protein LTV1 homolog [Drosophila nasuta]
MVKGKKPYIDRKKAVTFHLVHRSQHDPLVTDETAPQRVLLEAGARQSKPEKETPVDPAKRQEELKKFGIHFDDDYDYMQHLKKRENDVVWEYMENPNQAKKSNEEEPKNRNLLSLPSSVFASEFEESEGMLNKAAPQPGPRPDWDPDVVAALDSDFEDNEDLEDDFVMQAMGGDDDDDEEGDEDWEDDEEDNDMDFDSDNLNDDDDEENPDELMDRLAPLLRKRRFDDEETKSRFTEYSMSSSVIRRNEQLTLLDDRFERFYASYDDPELGDLALEEIEGNWHQKHPVVMQCFKEFKKKSDDLEYDKEWDRERVKKYENVVDGEHDPTDDLVDYEVEDAKEKKWDCESILSTYSNIYNHPKLIDEPRANRRAATIQIDPKTGLPTNVLRGGADGQLTAKALANLADDSPSATGPKSLCAKSVLSTLSVLSIRPKDETPEEKRERKRLLKDYRSERRIEKKANTEAFKEEQKRQRHVKINQRTNQQGSTIV